MSRGFGHTGQRRSDAARQRDSRAKRRMIVRRPCADRRRRTRLEKCPEQWLRYYIGPEVFEAPFSSAHKETISNTLWSVENGTGSATAIPRGDGKSSVFFGLALYLTVTGKIRFPVVVTWKHVDASEAIAAWVNILSDNERFKADYPEYCQPFEHSTHLTALRNMTWADTGERVGAAIKTLQKVIILPDSLGAIAARSAQGDAKGLYATLANGERLRPDFLLFDDAQDPDQADNPKAVQKTFDRLVNVFMGMGGPQRRLTWSAACTVERDHDVSCKFLAFPGAKSVRRSRIERWPGGTQGGEWKFEKGNKQRALWDEWNRVRLDGGQAKARSFFRKNRRDMCRGMKVLWVHRYDKERDVSAYDAAMFDYYNLGSDVFSRAQQQWPIKEGVSLYTLTPRLICSRVAERGAGEVPDWASLMVAATDINPSYGLTWGVAAFDRRQTCGVVSYGVHGLKVDQNLPKAQQHALIYEALVTHGRELHSYPFRPEYWFIDAAGDNFDVVLRFAKHSAQLCGIQAIPITGRNARNYRPYGRSAIGDPREQCHLCEDNLKRKWVAANADYWRELAQKAWIGSIGSPGSCSLPQGRHNEFAMQICREPLIGKSDMGAGMRWEWGSQPGPHDYGDVMMMMFAGAAYCGIGTSGQIQTRRMKNRRRVRHVKV